MTATRVSDTTLRILAWLHDLEQSGGGYEFRGVHGWATSADVADGTDIYGAADEVRRGVARGFYVREDVRVPDAASPTWIYRVTEHATRLLADARGRPHQPLMAPATRLDPRVYLRPPVLNALEALRFAAWNPARRVWIHGEAEWRTSRELTEWLKSENDRTDEIRIFFPEDLAWCVVNHLAERRRKPAILYRVTITGAAIQPLVWHPPERPVLRAL